MAPAPVAILSHSEVPSIANLKSRIQAHSTPAPAPAPAVAKVAPMTTYEYESVEGFFIQTGPKPKHVAFEDLLDRSFGMVDTSPDRWSNLRREVDRLQAEATNGVQYKVLFLGRHGQGWHNYGCEVYGVEPWETFWTTQYGDGELTWGPDPELTPLGHSQTCAIYDTWKNERQHGAPVNEGEIRWFVSPMQRTCQTMLNSWGDIISKTPEVWEDWREIVGLHTCDQRSSKSVIAERFPMVSIEKDFEEHDLLWFPNDRETDEAMQTRMSRAMDRLFNGAAPETYVSVTGHGGIFRNLLKVLGHQPYPLSTGEMIPVVVKATPVTPAVVPGSGTGVTAVNNGALNDQAINGSHPHQHYGHQNGFSHGRTHSKGLSNGHVVVPAAKH